MGYDDRGGGFFRGGGGRGGGFGGRGGGGGRGFGGRGGRGGDRGGFRGGRGGGFNRGYDQGPPESVVELGVMSHPCEDDLVCKATNEKVPYFNAPIFLDNKQQVGKVDEIFGAVRDFYFSIKLSDNIKAGSFSKDQKFFIDPYKLLPLQRFLEKPKARGGGGGRGGRGAGRGGGRGGFGGRGGGRGGGGGFRGGGGRGGGGGFRGGRGGGGGGRGGGRGGGYKKF